MGRDGEDVRTPSVVAYDAISFPSGLSVVCNADDTLVLARGGDSQKVLELLQIGVAYDVQNISGWGLQVASHNTETLWFHRKRGGTVPTSSLIRVGGTEDKVGRHIKYLGLTLDSC